MSKQALKVILISIAIQTAAFGLAEANEFDYSELRQDVVYGGELPAANDPISNSTVKLSFRGQMFCTGTLIAKDIVITAAHCADPFRAGGVEASVANNNVMVADFKVHPSASLKKAFFGLTERTYFDVMVLRLEHSVESPAVAVGLPKKGDRVSSKEELILAGYGCRNRGKNPDRGRLNFDIVSSARYIKGSSSSSMQINTTGAACKGDSGGPIYGLRNRKLVLFGITSWGDNYGLITRAEPLEPYLLWITQSVKELRSSIAL